MNKKKIKVLKVADLKEFESDEGGYRKLKNFEKRYVLYVKNRKGKLVDIPLWLFMSNISNFIPVDPPKTEK